MKAGIFVISLDFEIHWGVSDHRTIESYHENLKNVPLVVQRLLELFGKRGIHATWATVGMLFCQDKKELSEYVAEDQKPTYNNPALSNYNIIKIAGENETDDPFHYGLSLVKKIIATPFQEMATHTFSHYYCLEPGQTVKQFGYDLQAANKIAAREGVKNISIIFSRNQYNDEYLDECAANGIKTYRGNFPSWMYRAEAKSSETLLKRIARITDTYLPISGKRYVNVEWYKNKMLNIPGSCFLRPYNRKLSFLESLRISRIKNEMTDAAKKNAVYHLWWHPHNFGKDMDKNFAGLEQILDHFSVLNSKYGMTSLNMKEIYEQQSA